MKRKAALALCTGLFFYALSDVLLWQRIFEANDLFQFDRQYQSGHLATLVALIGVGVILLWDAKAWALWYAAAFYTLAMGGFCDVLYYWLDYRSVPAAMPWLNDSPLVLFKPAGGLGLVASAAVWLFVWTGILLLAGRGFGFVGRMARGIRPEVIEAAGGGARRQPFGRSVLAAGSHLAANLAAGEVGRVDVDVSVAALQDAQGAGEVGGGEVLAGDTLDVSRADPGAGDRPSCGRADRRAGRARVGRSLAQPEEDASVHAGLGEVDVSHERGAAQPRVRQLVRQLASADGGLEATGAICQLGQVLLEA